MRGIILAGGTGSRLGSLTRSINKHLLPVDHLPMICWPLKTLRDNGIEDITIVSSPSGVGQIAAQLGSGEYFGCKLTYCVQDQPGGVSQAFLAAKRTNDEGEDIAVILGDNVFLPSPMFVLGHSARCFLKKLDGKEKLKGFGVPYFYDGGKILSIVEKPAEPPSAFAVTGLYFFPSLVWNKLARLQVGKRGEFEITDLLNTFAYTGELGHTILEGFWGDAGTADGMAECAEEVRKRK